MATEINLKPYDPSEFDQTCREIAKEWRNKTIGQGRKTNAGPWLSQRVYELVEHIQSGQEWSEITGSRQKRLSAKKRHPSENLFRDMLHLIFIDERGSPTPQVRSRIALRLAHAYWHFVPAPFLVGFLSQAGPTPTPEEVQPGFEWWLAQELAAKRNSNDRRTYPKSIRKLLKSRKRRYWREMV